VSGNDIVVAAVVGSTDTPLELLAELLAMNVMIKGWTGR